MRYHEWLNRSRPTIDRSPILYIYSQDNTQSRAFQSPYPIIYTNTRGAGTPIVPSIKLEPLFERTPQSTNWPPTRYTIKQFKENWCTMYEIDPATLIRDKENTTLLMDAWNEYNTPIYMY
jgi:hypothetical protein